jgi:hypothetical protein
MSEMITGDVVVKGHCVLCGKAGWLRVAARVPAGERVTITQTADCADRWCDGMVILKWTGIPR